MLMRLTLVCLYPLKVQPRFVHSDLSVMYIFSFIGYVYFDCYAIEHDSTAGAAPCSCAEYPSSLPVARDTLSCVLVSHRVERIVLSSKTDENRISPV